MPTEPLWNRYARTLVIVALALGGGGSGCALGRASGAARLPSEAPAAPGSPATPGKPAAPGPPASPGAPAAAGHATVSTAVAHDVSAPLRSRAVAPVAPLGPEAALAPGAAGRVASPGRAPASPAGADVEQKSPGTGPAPRLVESFDGLGVGFEGPQGPGFGRNPSDNTLAVGP